VPASATLDVEGISPWVVPNADFYRIDIALQVPAIDPGDWTLRIHGQVENEVVLTWAELTALPLEEHYVTLACVSNEVGGDLIGNAKWLGYPLRELLAKAKPLAGADMALSSGPDGFTAGTPLEVLQDPKRAALLAIGMNGEPLPLEHGFPARMVVPGLYGYVSATKWVTDIDITRFADAEGYWTPRGWSEKGPVKISSRIDTPLGGVSSGDVTVAGVAWAQHTGISRVEVQVDGGAWQDAELATVVTVDSWLQWRFRWQAAAGSHTLRVRATDANGLVQTEADAPPAPDGSTGYHEVQVSVG
jgi:DMSO/TMAO reductase YedYZ molybdopterin-dependent catalytic subunit